MKKEINDLKELRIFAEKIAESFVGKKVFCNGNLGAGKTTFIKNILDTLGNTEASSPTFSIMQDYDIKGQKIWHCDLYRLDKIEELETIGFFDILDSTDTMFIEWANKFDLESEIPHYTKIQFEILKNNKRMIEIIEK